MIEKTSEGLRDRLFNVLDGVMEGRLKKDDVEAICYTSEQILKSAELELRTLQEHNSAIASERAYNLQLKKEQQESIVMLSETIETIDNG